MISGAPTRTHTYVPIPRTVGNGAISPIVGDLGGHSRWCEAVDTSPVRGLMHVAANARSSDIRNSPLKNQGRRTDSLLRTVFDIGNRNGLDDWASIGH